MSLFSKLFKKDTTPSDIGITMLDKNLRNEYNRLRQPQSHSTFCKAPLTNLYFSWEGIAIACCYNQTFVLGKYPEQTISEIWNSQKISELRKSLSNYDLTKGCTGCLKDIEIRRFDSVNSLRFDSLPISSYPTMMEFQLTNKCNLECVMCDGFLSSAIRANREKLPSIPEKYDDAFVIQLEEFIPHLKSTTFSGGEPFLIKIYYQIWDRIAVLNPSCDVNVITNGTIYNSRVEDVLNKNRFNITISLDSPNKTTYEKIRKGADFDLVIQNAKKFNTYCRSKGTRFNFNFCPMTNNWEELPAFIQLANEMEATFYLSVVYHPIKLSLATLPKENLEIIIDQLSAVKLPSNTTIQKRNKYTFEAFLTLLLNFNHHSATSINDSQLSFDEVLQYILNKITSYENENPGFSGDILREKINNLTGKLPGLQLNYNEIMPALENMSIESLENHLSGDPDNIIKLVTQKFYLG